jgi:hypothetical protein
MQRFTSKKRKRKSYEIKVLLGVVLFTHFLLCFLKWFRSAGGGKCPEEEHTTCSGGPTIIVTSAVYGEREYYYFIIIK